MCKTKKVFFIDSNNRNANSTSETDFKIDLDHPLILPDGCGVAIDSLSLPDTSNITPIVTGINDKLYFSLDDGTATTYSIITLPATNYSNEAMDILVADLQNALDNVYPGNLVVSQSNPNSSASINGAVGNWTRNTGLVGSVSQGLDNQR